MSTLLLGAPLAAIALCDLLLRRVPNWLVVAGLLVYVVGLVMMQVPGPDGFSTQWITSLTGLLAALLIFVPLWKFGAMGAGDVKFLGLLGFVFGLPGLIAAWLLGSVLVGVHTLAVLLTRNSQVSSWVGLRLRQGLFGQGATSSAPAQAPVTARFYWFSHWRAARMGSRKGAPYATYLALGAGAWLAWRNGLLG